MNKIRQKRPLFWQEYLYGRSFSGDTPDIHRSTKHIFNSFFDILDSNMLFGTVSILMCAIESYTIIFNANNIIVFLF